MRARPKALRRPAFGTDFGPGWVGFVHCPQEMLSSAIAYLTRRHRKRSVTITHTFLITGRDECVEANLPTGVMTSSLAESYLNVPERDVFFRRPRGLTREASRRIVRRARAQVGAKFDFGGFAAEGLADTFLGHLLDTWFDGKPRRTMAKLLHQHGRFICTDLVTYCLRLEPRYAGVEVLSQPPGTLTPQTLFEDDELFDPPGTPPGAEVRRELASAGRPGYHPRSAQLTGARRCRTRESPC